MSASLVKDRLTVKFEGFLYLSEEDILKFHPEVEPLLREIIDRGWKHRLSDVKGEAIVEASLKETSFRLHYYPPRLERGEEEGKYVFEMDVGPRLPKLVNVIRVDEFEIDIATEHVWRAASINPFTSEITHIEDVFWGWRISKEREPRKLLEAREVYEVAKWLLEEKKFKPGDEYEVSHYKELVDRFEKKYKFPIKLELTVEDMEKIPSWDDLRRDLASFLLEKGFLMKIKEKPKLFQKRPIP